MRVMVIDTGFSLGFGVLGRNNYVRSGTHRLEGSWCQMGLAFRTMTTTVTRLVEMHKPEVIGACRPFVSMQRDPKSNKFIVNHQNLIPIMGFYAKLQEIADELKLPFHDIYESDARKAFLSPAPVPRKSKDIKTAINAACEARGWPANYDHASDALCAADFLLAKLDPKAVGIAERTPLFVYAHGKKLAVKGGV